jgi:uncharacterized protein YbjT (DUF2867 family)
MAKILLLGATGRTGRRVLEFALIAGHEVVALVRSPEKITYNSDKLTIIEGDLSDAGDMARAIADCEVVISTLNNNRVSDSPFAKPLNPEDLMTKIMTNCVNAMKSESIRRIVVMTALGAGDSFDYSPWLFKFFIRKTNLGIAYRDHEGQEQVLKNSGLDWTVVRPVGLSDKPSKKKLGYAYGKPGKVSMMIERDKVAQYLVDCISNQESVGKAVALYETK